MAPATTLDTFTNGTTTVVMAVPVYVSRSADRLTKRA